MPDSTGQATSSLDTQPFASPQESESVESAALAPAPTPLPGEDTEGETGGLLFGLTIFVSAFLLFQVQPMIAKIIVPWFGGSSAVWATCLLFFQIVLMLGYLYADWLVRHVRPVYQARVHLPLLALGLLVLPILPKDSWKPMGSEMPTLRILMLLGATVGLPYFLLSTTSPLLQAWYGRARRGARPYRLYALSNAGSMLALLTYPVLVEPYFPTRHQAMGWSLAFVAFAALCTTLALRAKSGTVRNQPVESHPRPGLALRALWVALAACASTLLLAVTNHLTQNIAAIPFLWVLPLSLYLFSFILCFEGRGWYHRGLFLRLLAVAIGSMAYALSARFTGTQLMVLIPLFCVGLFICCMVCHGELARLKPPTEYLTSFYLMVALGGALGGVFVCLIAPHVFRWYLELPIGLTGCAVLVAIALHRDPGSAFNRSIWRPVWLLAILVLAVFFITETRKKFADAALMVRNFYGVLKIINADETEPEKATRELVNGTIDHGEEFLAPARRMQPTTYYGPNSGVGLALKVAQRKGPIQVGVIGLGAGTLAAYGRAGDLYTFYEINPLVIDLARVQFYFLRDSPAALEIVPGDARLSLERQAKQEFDVLAVDAFTGDAIPVHLLTREAFLLYFHRLKPDGVLAVHVSNKYLDLEPVVQRVASSIGKQAVTVQSEDDEENDVFFAHWVLVSGRSEFFNEPEIKAAGVEPEKDHGRLWTDDYSSLFGLMK
ncbi:MAG: fused MFS/spermidine synthase [Terriglobia bacterium]